MKIDYIQKFQLQGFVLVLSGTVTLWSVKSQSKRIKGWKWPFSPIVNFQMSKTARPILMALGYIMPQKPARPHTPSAPIHCRREKHVGKAVWTLIIKIVKLKYRRKYVFVNYPSFGFIVQTLDIWDTICQWLPQNDLQIQTKFIKKNQNRQED